MTTKNEEFQERLKASLKKANETLILKDKIESDISSILSMLKDITSDSIDFDILQNNSKIIKYIGCKKIVRIKKNSIMAYPKGFILFGFSINESTGYPVQVETEDEAAECTDVDNLKESIVYIIEKRSIEIMKLISEQQEDDDIPF
ncbi:hypothetical protein NUBL19415_50420 [Klebsiella pneumoniae]|uniref:Uncharacterized protein n=4 Tax=Klebsiella pneumoniae TaxID=573 RepID=A0A486WUG2_KLEPN|nr:MULTISPECIES: hypothetical protein [Klebsiella]HCI6877947.1 hypothetical protein [Klebsiella quasipneumoniae subsp. similipneumoniae]HCN1407641.1 hypothetical protein [Escherichia coli]EKJ7698232.1 hypothetical protein [Klebsiella pneumoniae]KDL87771.1 hypothetical protein AE02_05388 [Klebsiella variicola]MBG9423377.1 hypothetical protein [Klebsiella pneumoniae]